MPEYRTDIPTNSLPRIQRRESSSVVQLHVFAVRANVLCVRSGVASIGALQGERTLAAPNGQIDVRRSGNSAAE